MSCVAVVAELMECALPLGGVRAPGPPMGGPPPAPTAACGGGG